MKKTLFVITLMLSTLIGVAQQTMPQITMYDTTRSDGQRFIITYPVGGVYFQLNDSMTTVDVIGATGTVVTTVAKPVPGYSSVVDSRMIVTCKKVRIVMQDTLVTFPTLAIPLYYLENKPETFFGSTPLRKALKPTAKEWIKRKLKDN